MAKYAELDNNNKVLRVIAVSNDILDGEQFCQDTFGGRWKGYTSGVEASIGYEYNERLGKFTETSIFPSWHIDENGILVPPYPNPYDANNPLVKYVWIEEELKWVETIPHLREYALKLDLELLG